MIAACGARSTAPLPQVHLWPVSPQLAGGTQVVTVVVRETTTVRWVSDARALDKGTSMTIDGSVAAVDATGRVYAWQNAAGKLELALFRDGKRIGKLDLEPGGRGVWPDATGERVIVSGPQLVMFGPDGARVWTRPFVGVTHAVWLDDGAIAVVSALGIARLDAKTGETLVKRCGWAFELASKPHAGRPRIEPMCTQR
ncbi:MAG: hypothetical protein H0V17_22430 [Deltaproteobacteria bacterium]|nr:hypothetical protein [Deltaproteobacteria bacterium]